MNHWDESKIKQMKYSLNLCRHLLFLGSHPVYLFSGFLQHHQNNAICIQVFKRNLFENILSWIISPTNSSSRTHKMLFFLKEDAEEKYVKINMAQNWHHYALFFLQFKGHPANENKSNSPKFQINHGVTLERQADFSSNFRLCIECKELFLNWHSLQIQDTQNALLEVSKEWGVFLYSERKIFFSQKTTLPQLKKEKKIKQ